MRAQRTMVLVASLVFFARNVWTQESNAPQSQTVDIGSREANDTNAANNPIHPLLTVDLQNYFAPSPEAFPGPNCESGITASIRSDAHIRHSSNRTHNLANQHNCQYAGRTEYWSWRSDGLRFPALSRAWKHARNWAAAYRGTDRKRGGVRFWKMAGRRCRYCDCTSQLGTIGRACYVSALLLWKQFKPGWPAHVCATILYRQFPAWLLLPIYGSLDV
jgi:hypothetical protein